MTRTAEELRAEGRPEDEVRGYLDGVEITRRRIEEIMAEDASPPVPAGPPPKMGTPEWDAQQAARSLLKQDEALEALRQREQPQVSDYDAGADERRGWALQQAVNNAPAVQMDGRGGRALLLPNGAMVLAEFKNGLVDSLRSGVVDSGVILPHQWDEHDRAWRSQRRRSENELLDRTYGRDQCLTAGLFTEAEAEELGAPLVLPPGSPR